MKSSLTSLVFDFLSPRYRFPTPSTAPPPATHFLHFIFPGGDACTYQDMFGKEEEQPLFSFLISYTTERKENVNIMTKCHGQCMIYGDSFLLLSLPFCSFPCFYTFLLHFVRSICCIHFISTTILRSTAHTISFVFCF